MDVVQSVLAYLIPIILALGILVFVHELGHFLAARLFGMRVEKFSIGFPPKILGKKVGETYYQIGATPLGGYVKISGMIDESMDNSFAQTDPQPWEFRAKPVWQRSVVICAGVVFNLLLAVAIFIGLKYTYGDQYIPADRVEQVYVEPGSVAGRMGLRTGDRIVAVNGERIEYYEQIGSIEAIMADRMTITVQRDGREVVLTAPPDLLTQLNASEGNFGIWAIPSLVGGVLPDAPAAEAGLQGGDRIVAIDGEPVRFWQQLTELVGASDGGPMVIAWEREAPGGTERFERELTPYENQGRYMIGIQAATPEMLYDEFGVVQREYSFPEAMVEGTRATYTSTVATIVGFKRIFFGSESISENIGGPVAIAKATKEASDRSQADFWFLVAMLSITLAFLNILPIPALDGGHLVFLIYEGITRREPSLRFRMVVQQIGMVLILSFMVFVIFNDILRL